MIVAPTSEDYARYEKFSREFEGESDRAAAVLAGAYLDALLLDMLTGFLVDDSETIKLLSEGGPVSSFGARVRLAFCLGLVTSSVRRDLQMVGRIRNRFAHREEKLSFHDSPIRDMCSELGIVAFAKANLAVDHILAVKPRLQFLATVHFSMVHIRTAIREPRRTIRTVAAAD